MSDNFTLETTDGAARAGTLRTMHGEIKTPVFMPVATRGAIKAGVGFDDLADTGAQICLGNTYHLHLKPSSENIRDLGGLHKWQGWDKPILTDSGGFQVFSIQNKKITEEGVFFHSHIDGKKFFLDSETSMQIQLNLGSDIMMAFDECPPNVDNFYKIRAAVSKTTRWAQRSIDYFAKKIDMSADPATRPQLFGIIQGGCFEVLRKKSMDEITAMPFDGFAMGGLAVGETNAAMYKVLDEMAPLMPEQKPRYLMGVGTPTDLVEAIRRGIDMFDCVLPARNARHGSVFVTNGVLKIANAKWANDPNVLDENCTCAICADKKCSRAYLHHLFRVGEGLAQRYLTIHNLHYYQTLMQSARTAIETGSFGAFRANFLENQKNPIK